MLLQDKMCMSLAQKCYSAD